MTPRTLLAGCVLLLWGLPASAAGHWVEFEDGRLLRVDRIEWDGPMASLTLEGGGGLGVPAARIARAWPAGDPRPMQPAGRRVDELAEGQWRELAGEYAELIAAAAGREGLDPALLAAVAQVESGFDPYAVSHKGACGILQLMPPTAERFGVDDVFDVEQNLAGGARYLRWLMDRYEGDTELALAAYNAGEGAVDRHRGVPPYRETRTYVTRVMDRAGVAALP
jgi:soluble lytic murein transglycosylase-like protein